MKKVFSILAVVVVLVGTQSCANDCVECTGAGQISMCKKDYKALGGTTWEDYKANMLKNSSCKEK